VGAWLSTAWLSAGAADRSEGAVDSGAVVGVAAFGVLVVVTPLDGLVEPHAAATMAMASRRATRRLSTPAA
jgi:DNA-directed RNA polymerase subunit E'/Rpb7